jgi:putative membrane protein
VDDAAFTLSVPATLGVGALGLLYFRGWVRTAASSPKSGWRLLSFLAGLLVFWTAVGSPLSSLDHHRLSFHMLQHVLLMNLSAPLLLLGAPFAVLAAAVPRAVSRWALRGLTSPLAGFLTHPIVTWLFAATVVLGWHIPRVLALTLHSPFWHSVQHASFLLAGLLFFWPVVLPWPAVAVWPRWAMPLYLFLATLPCDVLAAFLAFSGRVVYPHYLEAHPTSSASALADQATAGALMWCAVTVGYLLPAVFVTLQLLGPRKAAEPATAA